MNPRVLTFDVFGTLLDWRTGLANDLREIGIPLTNTRFDAILTAQARLEQGRFRNYCEITRLSLQEVLGLRDADAQRIALGVGNWPLYRDSACALTHLAAHTRCVAMTNSDRTHGEQVQAQLGVRLARWICAEDLRIYKPSPVFWQVVAARLGIPLDRSWWHVSAYADYDLHTARALGLTTVFVRRPHSVAGPADHVVQDLSELVDLLEGCPEPSPQLAVCL